MFVRAESLLLIVVAGLLLFGWRRVPGAMRDLGRSRRILRSEVQALRDDVPLPPKRTIDGEVVPGPQNTTTTSGTGGT
ncbi:MAG TPA: twin-arginine translocase TatA/TatE family subunit [Actinocrinis sp.]